MGLNTDLKNVRVHGTTSAAELRKFLAKMHGKSPQEVLGLLAESGLLRATIQSTIGCVILIGVCSIGPYVWARAFPSQAPAATAAKNSPAPAPDPKDAAATPAADTPLPGTAAAAQADNANSSATNVDKAAKAMGIGDTKTADPKKNPLDKDLDKLLDDIK